MNRILLFIFLTGGMNSLRAQTITDGDMMPKNNLCTGFMYGFDRWHEYWEGSLKRDNLNVGSVTTQSLSWVGVFGINRNLNAIVMVPYVWTRASMGVLHGMNGVQDLSVSAKYRIADIPAGGGRIRVHGVLTFSTPMSRYTPDFLPLSIGLACKDLSWRLGANYSMAKGFFFNASGAYTWRSNITLDRTSYFSDGQFFLTDVVWMPNVFDYILSAGYHKHGLSGELNFWNQNTLGGGDIRRQDMPFASNRMNFSKAGALFIYDVPKPKGFNIHAGVNYTLAGRNVGQSVSVMAGLLYTVQFTHEEN